MKHEAIAPGVADSARDIRIETDYDVHVHCEAGDMHAQMLNLSSDGFRLRSASPLQAGWEVTLESGVDNPVKALICWACGLDAGGVFADPVAL